MQVMLQTNNKMWPSWVVKIVQLLFYCNYFYGVCVVALMLETTLRLDLKIGTLPYLLAFMVTVVFYNYPYSLYHNSFSNSRIKWLKQHAVNLIKMQLWLGLLIIILLSCIVALYYPLQLYWNQIILLLLFPLIGILYYGITIMQHHINIRQYGLFKPFIIGFVWAGICTIYPIIYNDIIHNNTSTPSLLSAHLFIKNMMFVALLAIIFDIKDIVADHHSNLKTIIIRLGLKKLIFNVLMPLTIAGILSFIVYASLHVNEFTPTKLLVILTPYVLLFFVIGVLKKKRSLLFYLVVIDGLILIKAVAGILFYYM